MKRSTLAALGGTTFGLAGAALAARAARRAGLPAADRLIYLQSEELSFQEIHPGVTRAVLRGDPDHGAHAAFVRFNPGVRIPRHTHPSDTVLVVLSGAYLYGADDGEQRVEPGSYFVVPAGTPHWSGSDPRDGAFFFQEGPGRFGLDLIH